MAEYISILPRKNNFLDKYMDKNVVTKYNLCFAIFVHIHKLLPHFILKAVLVHRKQLKREVYYETQSA